MFVHSLISTAQYKIVGYRKKNFRVELNSKMRIINDGLEILLQVNIKAFNEAH